MVDFSDLIPAAAGDQKSALTFDDLIAPRRPAAAAPPPKREGGLFGGAMTLYRSIPLMDEGAAALDSGVRLMTGQAHSIPEAWRQSRDLQGSNADDFERAHPLASTALKTAGVGASMLVPAGEAAQVYAQGSRAMNAARGAMTAAGTGYLYGATDRGNLRQRAEEGNAAATNPVGLALGAAGGVLATPRRVGPATTPTERLAQEGVKLTPGQRAADIPVVGPVIKSTEDLAQRAPILGPSIRGARQRGVESVQLVAANRALQPLGEALPPEIEAGHQATAYVAQRLGDAYDEAAAMVPAVQRDAAFDQALADISQRVQELPTDVGRQFTSILDNRLNGRFAPGATIAGPQLRDIQSEIGTLAASHGSSPDPAQRALGEMLDDVAEALADSLGRTNPQAAGLIQQANEGYANYVRLRNAGSRANGRGVPSISQMSQAVRMTDRSVGKGNVARGEALMQDLTRDASQVMPDGYGNPGTADAIGLGGLGLTVLTRPEVGIPATLGLSGAAVPYLAMGRGAVTPMTGSTAAGSALRYSAGAGLARQAGAMTGSVQRPRVPPPAGYASRR